MLIKNALVYMPERSGFFKADIQTYEDRIAQIEGSLPQVCHGDDVIDASGKFITPGLVEAHSHIGICEEIVGWAGDDICENTPVTPQMRAIDAINPFDVAFKDALKGGVTTVCTGPGSGGVVAGTFAILENNGACVVDNMVIKEDAAMKVAFGENPRDFGRQGKEPNTRMGVAYMLRKCLQDASDYKARRQRSLEEGKHFDTDLGMEQMLKVIDGLIPLKAHAHRADDICTAMRIAKEFKVKLTLDHCTEGHLIADHIAESGYPALVGPSFGSRSKTELANKTFATIPALYRAGVKTCIITDHNVNPQESLIMFAAMAKKAGLTEDEAMRCVTVNPAEILGISERKGSLAPGKDADIVVWNCHPLDIQAQAEAVYVRGRRML